MREPGLQDWLAEVEDPPPSDDDPPRHGAPGRGRRRLWLVAGLSWTLVAAAGAVVLLAPDPAEPGTETPDAPPEWAGEGAAEGIADVGADAGGGVDAGTDVGAGVDAGAGAGGDAGTDVGADAGAGGDAGTDVDAAGVVGAGVDRAADPATSPGVPAADDAAVEAAAAVAVRLALTVNEPGGRARYVDLALPAGVAWYGEVAIVTVHAVVLDADGDGWREPRAVRYAQPVRAGQGHAPHPLGAPWPLPPLPAGPGDLAVEPVDDPAAVTAAASHLVAAGYSEVDVTAVARIAGHPQIRAVTATARAPGEPAVRTHEVWVAEGPDAGVLGATAPRPDPTDQEE